MTIAACYLSSEGVVLGADSTSTMFVPSPGPQPFITQQHFNFAQKVFRIGEEGTLGIVMWGLGSMNETSYRTLIARFADGLKSQPPHTMSQIAIRWNEFFHKAYLKTFEQEIQHTQRLMKQEERTTEEQNELMALIQNFSGGFCIGGCCLPDRTPEAFEVAYSPDQMTVQAPIAQDIGSARFWGCPNLIHRLVYGVDFGILDAIMQSGMWTGNEQDLFNVVEPHFLGQSTQLPIREAIDWVHASIYATIKTMKFSHLAPVCGGPIEVAAITSDRQFRWVCHKRLDSAVAHDGFPHV